MINIPIPLAIVKNIIRSFKKKADWRNIPRSRAGFEKITSRNDYRSKKCEYIPVEIAHCHAEWIKQKKHAATKVLLYFHGGGYAAGSVNTHRSLLTKIALSGNYDILSFEYRLAPENPFPAALNDAVMAFEYLLSEGYLPNDIAMGGDSAGGGLTLGTMLFLRDNNKPLPKCAICLSPWTDLTLSGNSYHDPKIDEPMITKEAFPLWTKNYYAEHDPADPYISPLFGDYRGLPPIYIQVGTAEVLFDDSVRVYEKAKADGIDIEIEIYEDYFHVFQSFWRILPKANYAIKKLSAFLDVQLVVNTK